MTNAQAGLVLQHVRRLAGLPRAAQPPDAQLLERFTAQRDEAAFAALVQRHGPMVLNVCRSVLRHEQDAEDAFQATFLALSRQAASLRQPAAVAGWLYEVAYRVAVKAQAEAARRRAQERKVSPMPPPDPTLDMTLRDLHRVLHEELRRLPEKYRLPLVLCYLESRSQDEAASQLGWSKGTLRGRLDRGREQLRRRLAARGVTLSGLLCTTAVAPRVAAAALVDSVVRAAVRSAVDGAVAGALSARVSALAEGVTQTMLTSKLKVALAVFLTVGLVAGAGALARQAPAARESPAGSPKSDARNQKPEPAATKDAAKRQATDEPDDAIDVNGRVVDLDGRPFVGAKVFFARSVLVRRDAPAPPPPAVTTDADGRFRLRVSRTGYLPGDEYEKDHWLRGVVVAVGQGFGPGWVGAASAEKLTNVTVKLTKEVPIAGRVLDLQGQPVAGVSVQVRSVHCRQDGGDLKAFVEALQSTKQWPNGPSAPRTWLDPALLGLPRPAVTGVDGQFRVTGLGGECLVGLRFEGPTIEAADVYAMTRPAPTIVTPRSQDRPELGNAIFRGNTFDYAAAPTRPIRGIVRDRDTGKPMAGVTIRARMGSTREHFARDPYLETTTDEEGRYRLIGLSREGGHRLEVLPGRAGPYLPATKPSGTRPGLEPVTEDFTLKRGVRIRGRLTNKETGRPVRAVVRYGAFANNPHLKEAPGFRHSDSDLVEVRTAEDGSFTLLGLPGPGLLAVKAADREEEGHYVTGAGADAIRGPRWGADHFDTEPSAFDPSAFNALVQVNPAQDAASIVCDVVLDPGQTVTGTIVDPDGKPVKGASIDAIQSVRLHMKDLPTAEFRVPGVDPKHPRWYFVRHGGRNLGTVVLLKGDEPAPVTVRLQKCGTITGRVVDDDGLPRAAWILSVIETEQLKGQDSFGVGSSPLEKTGKDGRFRIVGVIPGHKTGVYAGKNTTYFDPLVKGLILKAGEVKDLGDVKVKPSE
jgi:RNA polymerase sigma factor (sigma-70 family)